MLFICFAVVSVCRPGDGVPSCCPPSPGRSRRQSNRCKSFNCVDDCGRPCVSCHAERMSSCDGYRLAAVGVVAAGLTVAAIYGTRWSMIVPKLLLSEQTIDWVWIDWYLKGSALVTVVGDDDDGGDRAFFLVWLSAIYDHNICYSVQHVVYETRIKILSG